MPTGSRNNQPHERRTLVDEVMLEDGFPDDLAVAGGGRRDRASAATPHPGQGHRGKAMPNLNDLWEIVCERAGPRDLRIHDARHSDASRALAPGESLPMIGRLLVHTHVQTTVRYRRAVLLGC